MTGRTPTAVRLAAYDLLGVVDQADNVEDAVARIRAEVEVLPREELVRLVVALSVEGRRLVPHVSVPRWRQLLDHGRLEAMWSGS